MQEGECLQIFTSHGNYQGSKGGAEAVMEKQGCVYLNLLKSMCVHSHTDWMLPSMPASIRSGFT